MTAGEQHHDVTNTVRIQPFVHWHSWRIQIISVHCYRTSVRLSLSPFTVSTSAQRTHDIVRLSLSTGTCHLSSYLCPLLHSVNLCTVTHDSVRLSLSAATCHLSSYLCPLLQSVYLCTAGHDTIRFGLLLLLFHYPVVSVLYLCTVTQDTPRYLCPLPHVLCPIISVLFYSQFACATHGTVRLSQSTVTSALSSFTVSLPMHCQTWHFQIIYIHFHSYLCPLSQSLYLRTVTSDTEIISVNCHMSFVQLSLSSFPISLPVHCHIRHTLIMSVYCLMSSVQLYLSSFTVRLPVHCHTRHSQIMSVYCCLSSVQLSV